jgi:hypothetical protein
MMADRVPSPLWGGLESGELGSTVSALIDVVWCSWRHCATLRSCGRRHAPHVPSHVWLVPQGFNGSPLCIRWRSCVGWPLDRPHFDSAPVCCFPAFGNGNTLEKRASRAPHRVCSNCTQYASASFESPNGYKLSMPYVKMVLSLVLNTVLPEPELPFLGTGRGPGVPSVSDEGVC